jgi:hypothetical protein
LSESRPKSIESRTKQNDMKSCDSGLFYEILIENFGPFLLGLIWTRFVNDLYKKRQNPNLFSMNLLSTNCLTRILSLFCDLHHPRLATFSSSSVNIFFLPSYSGLLPFYSVLFPCSDLCLRFETWSVYVWHVNSCTF